MQEADSPYDQLGGETAIRTLVNRFYDLMDSLSVVQEIRHLHPQDLMSSRDKLFKFLSGWLGAALSCIWRNMAIRDCAADTCLSRLVNGNVING